MPDVSSEQLRVAVVGAGPAGIYVADALTKQSEQAVRVDLFDRLPTPFGLLRYGVAPDHLKMKNLIVTLQRVLDDPRVSFAGNVAIGRDVTVPELLGDYHAVVYSFGASVDRRLGIPGEDLAGSHSATAFVAWYSGHPDANDLDFDLTGDSAAVIGLGNVALDVARVLLRDPQELAATDVPDAVLRALAASSITDVHIVGRRGPQHVKFTHKELREIGELAGVDVVIDPADLVDAGEGESRAERQILTIFREWAERSSSGALRRLHLHFWSPPVAVLGDDRVTGLRIERHGAPVDLPVQLVLRSVGYAGVGVPGVPVDADKGVIPTEDHRVMRKDAIAVGEYASGWIKRGATGVIGTNRSDASDTAAAVLSDASTLLSREVDPGTAMQAIRSRAASIVTLEGWSAIDAAEVLAGTSRLTPRVKLATWDELLAAATTSG